MSDKMKFLSLMLALLIGLTPAGVSAQERGRIKRPPPTRMEAERIASDVIMNDSSLQKGDIVVTDKGFFVFRGVAVDGYTFDFAPVAGPLPAAGK